MEERYIREELRDKFSMNGLVNINEHLLYCHGGEKRKYYTYTTQMVDSFIKKIASRGSLHYAETDIWLYSGDGKIPPTN